MCDVIPRSACFVCVVMRLRLDKKLLNLPFLCFDNLFLRRYDYVLCNVSLNTPIACSLVRFPRMTSSLAIVNNHFLAFFFSKIS